MASAPTVIEVHNLTKVYRLGEHRSLRGDARRAAAGTAASAQTLLALDDVSFSIDRGECFGIVGINGSGKSTLLQVISQITLPTSGHAIVRGRVLPLLAVGTGFHPELTGRENVVLFGTVLGFPRRAIVERMDEIIDYSEIGLHIDTPLKRYSSGMSARLSFAVAVMFPAAISIFDEVLAVTDDEFTTRCLQIDRRRRGGPAHGHLRQPRCRLGPPALHPRHVARARRGSHAGLDRRGDGCVPRSLTRNWPASGLEACPACPACGTPARGRPGSADLADRLYGCAPGLWSFQRCARCGAAYLDPRPTRETIADAYGDYYTHVPPADSAAAAARPHRWLAPGAAPRLPEPPLRPLARRSVAARSVARSARSRPRLAAAAVGASAAAP